MSTKRRKIEPEPATKGNAPPRPLPRASYDFGAIPRVLRRQQRWVCWRYALRAEGWTKVPVMPAVIEHAGKFGPYTDFGHAKVNEPETWSNFEACVEEFERRRPKTQDQLRGGRWQLDGIGMVLVPDDGLVGIDLDKVLPDPDIEGSTGTAWANPIVDLAGEQGALVELSPSGTGVHIIGRGKLPGDIHGRRGGNCEIYSGERYLCMTGALLFPVKPRLPNIQTVIELALAHVEANSEGVTVSLSLAGMQARVAEFALSHPLLRFNGDDDVLIGAMFNAANGAATAELWSGGGNIDRSAGDASLLERIAWWAGPDPERVERVFGMSERTREKWDQRIDYRTRSVLRAIMFCIERGPSGFRTPLAPFNSRSLQRTSLRRVLR